MKRNHTLKLATGLMALTMITTCFVGNTFAKYTSHAEGRDVARVAKWGVQVDVTGSSMFKTEYTGTDDKITVKSSDINNVVAPGTKGEGLTFSVKGTPEVATKLDMYCEGEDIFFKYMGDSETYYPIKYSLYKVQDGSQIPVLKDVTFAQISEKLGKLDDTTFAPNETIDMEYFLTWEWPFESGHDDYDSTLGDKMANGEFGDFETFNNLLNATIAITVEQVD